MLENRPLMGIPNHSPLIYIRSNASRKPGTHIPIKPIKVIT